MTTVELILWTAGSGSAGLLVGAIVAGPGVYRWRLRRTVRAMEAYQREEAQLTADREGLPELAALVRQASEHERLATRGRPGREY